MAYHPHLLRSISNTEMWLPWLIKLRPPPPLVCAHGVYACEDQNSVSGIVLQELST